MLSMLAKVTLAGFMSTLSVQLALPSVAQADSRTDTFKALDSDSADHSCQIVLRSASLKRDSSGLPLIETDSNGKNWYSFESSVDAAVGPLSTGTTAYLLYRASDDSQWHTAPGLMVSGAPNGLQRMMFRLSEGTLAAIGQTLSNPDGDKKLHLIPYLQTSDGRRIFDHNSTLGDSDSLILDGSSNWSVQSDANLCPTAGRGATTLRFLGNWTIEQRGLPQPGQSLLLEYDLNRLPQCQASSYNGLPAWQTDAMIRFYPSGEEFSAAVNTLQNGKMVPSTARFEIPLGSTHVQMWFKTRGRNCDTVWDSNFGRNYEVSLRADVAPSPAWAGQWRMLSGQGQCFALDRADALAEVSTLSEPELKSCRAIEAEVLVPGLTTSLDVMPEAIQAQVKWSLDGVTQRTQWLNYSGRSGQNYRFRWILPSETLRQVPWRKLDYSFQFSTDGLFWLSAGRAESHHNGIVSPRTIQYRNAP